MQSFVHCSGRLSGFTALKPDLAEHGQTFIPGKFSEAVLPPSTGSACPVT
jgi:hypothetical protein